MGANREFTEEARRVRRLVHEGFPSTGKSVGTGKLLARAGLSPKAPAAAIGKPECGLMLMCRSHGRARKDFRVSRAAAAAWDDHGPRDGCTMLGRPGFGKLGVGKLDVAIPEHRTKPDTGPDA